MKTEVSPSVGHIARVTGAFVFGLLAGLSLGIAFLCLLSSFGYSNFGSFGWAMTAVFFAAVAAIFACGSFVMAKGRPEPRSTFGRLLTALFIFSLILIAVGVAYATF